MTGWRIIFMGTPDFACPTLKILVDRGENLVAVFTQPDRPKGRGQKMQPPPVKLLAEQAGIPVYQPPKIRTPEVLEHILGLKPDLIVVVAYGQILPKALLDIPPKGCINVHASLLPKYRGAAPLNWCIANGETETGVTTMLMDVGLDTGPMLLKRSTEIAPDEDIESLNDRMSDMGALLLAETLDQLKAGNLKPEPQDDSISSYAPLLKKTDGLIDWSKTASDIRNQIRAFALWPGAYTEIHGNRVKLFKASASDGNAPCGTVVSATPEGIEVACGKGSLLILELQPSGGRRMDTASFLSGHPVSAGGRFTSISENNS